MTTTERKAILFEIWALLQDNLRRGENYDRAQDEAYKKMLLANMKECDERIEYLKNKLK